MIAITREAPLKTSKEMPFIVFLFFLFIYVSVFYACSLSPSSVLHSSTFWFFISNTLIFIVAVDYGAFSPPGQKLVVYLRQEYNYPHVQTNPIVFENLEDGLIKSVVGRTDPENPRNDPENPKEDSSENSALFSMETTKNGENPVEERKPETVGREETIEEEAEDQFSKMTDEELNRRVEEFIKRFNKQIRLQKIREKLQKSETI